MVQRPQRPGKIISDGDREVHLCGLMEVEEKLWENGGSLWDGRPLRAGFFFFFFLAQRVESAGKICGGNASKSVWFRSLRYDRGKKRGGRRVEFPLG